VIGVRLSIGAVSLHLASVGGDASVLGSFGEY